MRLKVIVPIKHLFFIASVKNRRILSILFLLFLFSTTAQAQVCGTSASTPFVSLGQARNVTSAGVYHFNINGTAFSTYVDTNGYVQVAIDFGNGVGNLLQGTSLTNSTRGILSPTVLAELTDASEARISHSGGTLDVTTTNSTLLARITTNTTLHQGTSDNDINNTWTGTLSSALTNDATCTTSSGTALHQNIAHVCGNTNGMHWIPATSQQQLTFDSGDISNTQSLTLWVRAAEASDTDCDGVLDRADLDDDNDGILDTDEGCSERLSNPGFDGVATGSHSTIPGWTLAAGGGTVFSADTSSFSFSDEQNNTTFTQTISQTGIQNLNLGQGEYGAAQVLINMKVLQSDPIATSVASFLEVRVGGTLYARVDTGSDNVSPASATVTYSNGANGNLSSFTIDDRGQAHTGGILSGVTLTQDWIIDLPASVSATGTVQILYDPSSAPNAASNANDDFTLTEVSIIACQDTDGDGILDSLDTDSDNDGCPDATEGANNIATTATLTGGSNGGSSANLGTNVDSDGIPTVTGSSQATTAGVTISDVISAVTITSSPTPAVICAEENITFTATPTGLRVVDFVANTTISIPTGDYIYNWYIGASTTPLTDTAPYSNTNTAALTITGATAALSANVYRVEVTTANNVCPTEESVTLTVNALPSSATSGGDVTYCDTIDPIPTLTASAQTGEEIDWYDMATGGILLQANSFTYTPPSAGTYYVESRTTVSGCVSATRIAITLTSVCDPCDPVASGNTDTDGDGVSDICDLDDDNDGILDANECSTISANNDLTVTSTLGTSPSLLGDGIGPLTSSNQSYRLNETGEGLIVDLGAIALAGTDITIIHQSNTNNIGSTFTVEQSQDNITYSNLETYTVANTSQTNLIYTVTNSTQYIRIILANRLAGRVDIENVFYNAFCGGLDTDGDGIPGSLDTDSDGDGCPDTIEAAVPTVLTTGNVVNGDGTTNTTTSTANAVIDIATDPVGTNGYASSLESDDTFSSTALNAYIATNHTTYALDDTKNGCGTAMITQIYRDNGSNNNWIEITNIHPTNVIVPNGANVNLFNGGVTTSRTATDSNTLEIPVGGSVLFKNTGTIGNITGTPIESTSLTGFDATDDIITISRANNASGSNSWDSRLDVIENISDRTSYVRIDETTAPNTTFTSSEWVAFVDDNLDPYRDLASGGPERHPHDPLLSEIVSSNTDANTLLGLHRINGTTRTSSSWDNGFPDRSRYTIINENYEHTGNKLSARKLEIQGTNNLTVTDQLLIVTNNTNINTNAEIRIAGTGQFIQTHTGARDITGGGSLFIDQNSEIPSIYRYNYMSSPVNTIGSTTFSVADVLKDGTNPTSSSSTPLDINFIGGYDGSDTSPISLAEHWIYTFASADGTTNADGASSNWAQQLSTGTIPETDGFIFKGPGISQNYTFEGTPKDGDLTTIVGGSESYLVGNPFASALSTKKFIEDNVNSIDGTLYFWEHAGEEDTSTDTSGHAFAGYIGGYATRNISMGLAANQVTSNDNSNGATPSIGNGDYRAPGSYIAVGQAFFIGGDADGGAIVFNNSQREYITEGAQSIFFRNNAETQTESLLPIIKLGMNYVKIDEELNMHRQIGISFDPNNSFNYDRGYDSYKFDLEATDVYWKFPEDENKYSIAGVEGISDNLEIPLAILMGHDGDLIFTIDEWQNINRDVYITDLELGVSYKINGQEATISLTSGEYLERFVLTFSEGTLSNHDLTLNQSLTVFSAMESQQIVIKNRNATIISKVELYNILGQKIKSWALEGLFEEELKLDYESSLKGSVYILNMKTNKGVVSKKIVL